ncbi:hypothetical protein B0H10DRAFT_2137518, partial [Mycena sp. CBHHK59/15]
HFCQRTRIRCRTSGSISSVDGRGPLLGSTDVPRRRAREVMSVRPNIERLVRLVHKGIRSAVDRDSWGKAMTSTAVAEIQTRFRSVQR